MDVKYFTKCLTLLPTEYTSADTNRMTLLYFIVSGLDLLSHPSLSSASIHSFINANLITTNGFGFSGSTFHGVNNGYNLPHIAMTYTALATLCIMGLLMHSLPSLGIIHTLSKLQQTNGSFGAFEGCDDGDMRFLYCACAVSTFLNDWTGIDKESAVDYILRSQAFDGGFGQGPFQGSHGGSTYCAIASLSLMGKLDVLSRKNTTRCVLWLIKRQVGGFEGRPFKPVDSCYSFWIGASLKLLNRYELVDVDALQNSLNCSHSKYGGYSKLENGAYPDLLHSYMGLSGLSISGRKDLLELNCELGVSNRAYSVWVGDKK